MVFEDIQLARWLAFLESDCLPPLGPQPLPEGESLISVDTGGLWKGESRGLSDTDFEMLGLAMGFLRNLRVELHIQAV